MVNLKDLLPDGVELGKVFTGHGKAFKVNETTWLPRYKTADLALTPIAKKFKGKRIRWTGGVGIYFYFGKVDDVVARKNAIKAELAMRKAGFLAEPGWIDNSSPGGKKGIYLSVLLADDEAFKNVKGIDKL